jgi:predicted phosphodiesterase
LSSSTTTPVILPEDIKFYLSGGYYNSDPLNSLGGETSSFQLTSGTLNGLFDRVDTSEAEIGDIEYRCVYLRNTSQTRKLLGTKIWIETGTASSNTSIAISLGSSGINGIEPTIPDEGIEPPMNFFEIPLQAPDEPNIGDLYPGDHIALWIRWYVQPATQSIADDFAVIRIDGEREPESISQPLPDPTDPPPTTGCPQGSKWSPVEFRCVDDSTVIICPNGYTYNSTTQRCVPPTTPPPSVPIWTFGAGGDFSCTSDADASGVLIGSKLNKTAGNDIGLFLALGDFSYQDGDESCWFDNMQSNLGAMYPNEVAPILGNHDDGEDGSDSDRTDVIAEFPLMPTEAYYAFTRRNIRFIMMDTQSSYTSSSTQYAFVVAQLQQAAANPAIKWKVVCYHKPSFTTGSYYGPLTDFRNLYHPLFDQYKVDLIFNGHNHIYFRSKPVRHDSANVGTPIIASDQATGNYINIDGRVFITAGASGRSSHTEYDSTAENFVGMRHAPSPYGNCFITLQDSGNQLRVQFITNGNQVLDDFTLHKPGATPPPTGDAVCPQGFHYDDTLGRCVISPQQCPTNYRWEPTQNRCVASTGEPPPTTTDPMIGVEWYYDSTATQNTPQTINAGASDSVDGVITVSSWSSVASTTIANGWITVKSGTATPPTASTGRIGIDYYEKARYNTDDKPGFNTAFTFTFLYNGSHAVGIMDGNDPAGGGTYAIPNWIFSGFAFSIFGPEPTPDSGFFDGIGSRVQYYHNLTTQASPSDTQIISSFPGGKSLEVGKTYKVFGTYRTNRITMQVIGNVWIDFGDGDGWVKCQTDRVWSLSNWNPTNVPTGYTDTSQIIAGPANIKRHRLTIRNNHITAGTPPDLLVKDIKIGTLPYLSDVSNPPPPGGGGGGGSGTGGVLDSRGIRWYYATGQQGLISQSRDEATDDRWSGNVSAIGQYGYETTMIMQNFQGTNSSSHFAMKHGGPNHSGDCDHTEGGSCCCWYDTGIRVNGDVQLQIERPHPNNDDFSLPSSQQFIQNIGKGMEGNSIGLKWVWHPVTPGGSADNGGIRLMMWVDTDPVGTDGKPKNNWRLVYDFVDTGQVLGDYPPPDEHDFEIRNSDTDSRTVFGGGFHWRKIQANDTLQWGTALPPPSGGGGSNPPPPPPPTGSGFKIISWGDNDTTQDAEDVLNQIMTETNVSQYLFAGDGPYSNSGTAWINMMSSYFNTSILKGKLMLAQGNHEHPESESQQAENDIEAWFPGLHNATEGLEWLQYKIVGNVAIIVMNSQDSNIDQVGGAQMNWVQARLNEAVAARTAGTIKWIVMMVHKNWFSITNYSPDAFATRYAYQTMITNAQVDFMFSGHTHTYQLWKPIVARTQGDETDQGTQLSGTLSGTNWNFALTHGVCHIINGNGGHEINSFGSNPMPSTILYANDDEFGYTVLEIDGSTARIIAKSVGGNVRHTVTFVR